MARDYKWMETAKLSELDITDVPYTMLMLRVLYGVHSTDMLLDAAMRLGRYQPTLLNRVRFLRSLGRLWKEEYVQCHKDQHGERHWQITPRGQDVIRTGGEKRGSARRKSARAS